MLRYMPSDHISEADRYLIIGALEHLSKSRDMVNTISHDKQG